MRWGQRLAAVGALAAAAMTAWLLIAPDPKAAERGAERPAVAVSKAGIVLWYRGERQAAIKADRVVVSTDGRRTVFSGSVLAQLFQHGATVLSVTGVHAVLERPTQNVRIDGGVRLTAAGGETVTAPEGAWDQASGVIDLTGGVEVTFRLRRAR